MSVLKIPPYGETLALLILKIPPYGVTLALRRKEEIVRIWN